MEVIAGHRFKRTVKYLRAFIILFLFAIILFFIIYLSVLGYAKILGAPPTAVPKSSIFYAKDGRVIGETNSAQKRYWVPLSEISSYLIEATVSVEDRHFFQHKGFDPRRIAGAALADIQSMSKAQGASTITQQYARNLYLQHDKTWGRKISEAFYTIRLEMNYSKKDILEGYLNTIYYGHGAYGIEAASKFYFGKDAKDLTLGEASMLAGIPKGPAHYSPYVSMDHAKQRQKVVLNSMTKSGYISKGEAKTAESSGLHIIEANKESIKKIAPYFQDAVKQALKTQLHMDDRTIELGGLRIYTTLDPAIQKAAEDTFDQVISKSSQIQGALVTMSPKTGEVRALVGGRDYKQSSFNRAVQAVRQPGSTIKPLLYYAALEHGFTPSTTLRSEVTTFTYDNGHSTYTPHNFNHQYANDEITLAQAIALSDNVFAVKTHMFLGEDTLIKTAKRFGIQSKMAKVPSLALGTSGVRVIEMVNAYSYLANGGKEVHPVFINKVVNHKGEVIYENKPSQTQVLNPDLAFEMTSLLTGIFDKKLNGYAKVTGSTIASELTRPYAGKSGTTEYDSWMIGYTPQLVTGVWTGYDSGSKIESLSEKGYAKKIWADFMETSLKEKSVKKFKPTSNIIGVYVNPSNGKLATDDCPVKRYTYYLKGTEPTEYCMDHVSSKESDSNHKKQQQKSRSPWYKRIFGQ